MRYYKKSRRRSDGGFWNTLKVIVIAQLVIGLIGSMSCLFFSRFSTDSNADKTKNPTTSVTDPTEAVTDPTVTPDVDMISFNVEGTYYSCPAGMTWEEFANSNYDTEDKFTVRDNLTYFYMGTYEVNVKFSAQDVPATDVIVADQVYTGV